MKQKPTLTESVTSWRVWLVLITMLTMCFPVQAQVTIGDGIPANKFSVLELSTQSTKGGLRLPHLDNIHRDQIITDIKSMPAGAEKDAALKAVNGLTIYNTDSQCTEYWDSREWISLCVSSASFSFNDDDIKSQLPVPGTGGTVGPVIPGGGSGCTLAVPYTVEVVAGAEFLNGTDIVTDNTTGEFSVDFLPNPTAYSRYVVVRVTDNCSNLFRDISLQQTGNTSICVPSATIPVVNGKQTTMCQGAELPLWLTSTVDGYEYIWLLNGKELSGASGTSYVATRAGKYTVVVGAAGCPNSTSLAFEITQDAGTVGAAPVISATNGGVMCGGSQITLSAMVNGASTSVDWYLNGVYKASGTSYSTQGQTDEGTWTAYTATSCGSKQSNSLSVTYDGSSGGGLNPVSAQINGQPLAAAVLCKGGSMELRIANAGDYADKNPRYEWYINGNEIYTGTDAVKVVNVPDYANMIIEVRVITGGNCPLSVSASTSLNPTDLAQPKINNGKTIDYVCGSSLDLMLTVSNQTGTPTGYEWYKNGTLMQTTGVSTLATKEPGKYQVRYTDGNCWSKLSNEIELVSRGYLNLSWIGNGVEDGVIGTEVTVGINAVPEALSYVWSSSDPAVIKVTQIPNQPRYATVQYLTVGTAAISVKATNECGEVTLTSATINSTTGCAEAENLKFTASTLDKNPATVEKGQGGLYHVSWTGGKHEDQDVLWTITSPSGHVESNWLNSYFADVYPILSFDESGTWTIKAQAYKCGEVVDVDTPTGHSATMTVMVTPTAADVDAMPQAPATYGLSGTFCFDNNRRGTHTNSFASGYEFSYTLSGTPATDITAFVTGDNAGAVESISVAGNVVTIKYKESVVTVLDKDGVQLRLNVLFKGASSTDYKYVQTIRIQDYICCGAKTTSGGWLTFMCHNLGADESLDPFTYVVGNADGSGGTLGHLYQWGRKADGHQLRNSIVVAGAASGTELDADGQVSSTSAKYGKLIDATRDWRTPTIIMWGNGTDDFDQPKSKNDPCPDGWKVPSRAQWHDVLTNKVDNKYRWNGRGGFVGNFLYLPAAGERTGKGLFRFISLWGMYSTTSALNHSEIVALISDGGGAAMTYGAYDRVSARSVRCVSE